MSAQDTVFYDKNIWHCRGKILDLTAPVVMGILNVSPDSFFDGGKYVHVPDMLARSRKMIDEGVQIIDIGAYSTRPGAEYISEEEELARLIPAIREVRNSCARSIISADTWRSNVAAMAIEAGADIINDISGGTFDDKMFETVSRLKVPYVLTHIKGEPRTMQDDPTYENVVSEVMEFFRERIDQLNRLGTKTIILDPGFGFGKTTVHNYTLLKNIALFKTFGLPILAGISRKSMVNKILKTKPQQALSGTIVANTIALLNGAVILRVHDVVPAVEAIKIVGFYQDVK